MPPIPTSRDSDRWELRGVCQDRENLGGDGRREELRATLRKCQEERKRLLVLPLLVEHSLAHDLRHYKNP